MYTTDYIESLRREDACRTLGDYSSEGKWLIQGKRRYLNFSSNDYLGLSDTGLQREFFDTLDTGRFLMSNPSSRLMTGNGEDYHRLESLLSSIYGDRAALILGSGFLVNSGTLAALTSSEDMVIADKYVHASIIDGLRLCDCKWTRYRHNDMNHLEHLIRQARETIKPEGEIWVVTESLFSMDGDFAPIADLLELKHKYGVRLYIDEAHAFGVFGSHGQGILAEWAEKNCLQWKEVIEQIDILVATFGKATSSQGAFVVCDTLTREVLINRMRTLIYSTALPPISLKWSEFIIERFGEMADRRSHLKCLTAILGGQSQIIPIIIGDNTPTIRAAESLKEAGYWVTAIRHPTVAAGSARIRVSLSAAITEDEVLKFRELCRNIGLSVGFTTDLQ